MLIDVSHNDYRKYFSSDPHPFISDGFIELNKSKADQIVRLVEDTRDVLIGLVGGIIGNTLKSPFSAPFGGFHFRNEKIHDGKIDRFISFLKSYIMEKGLKKVEITLPPDIYHQSFNAKIINSLLRGSFTMSIPEITHWVDLEHFKYVFSDGSSRTKYNQAVRNRLCFQPINELNSMIAAYGVIYKNRISFGRPIYMTFDNLMDISRLWPVDFFGVTDNTDKLVASAVLYRGHPKIVQAIFWGDNDSGRSLRAMDFLLFNLWAHYKRLGYSFVDAGISTESGFPNEGLLRFKQTHDALSSCRFSFTWSHE